MFPLSPIKQIELAASKIPGAVSLAQGIPSFNLHPEILAFVEERIRAGVCDRYSLTNGLQELREEISLSLAADGMHYDPDSEIICTVGSIQAISAALLAITTPGDEVLILSPTYTSYQGVIAMARCSPKFISLNEEKNFDIDQGYLLLQSKQSNRNDLLRRSHTATG
jgi:N-succinyldiaminopimelate aminotransferase